ncbi:ankyrin repeat domain-containing protein [Serratia rubidaea]|uniref:ankyrin repeat domain-containing protein n=1 Tax=Serratia rubidaea TaxID=61652 RepID=UPI0022B8F8A1|nr:ankyrin repeat domain-containing protein [Serratia rubidaea]WBF44876.1 ankyrin repeat domain-containing protein [Serratia rubidaea]
MNWPAFGKRTIMRNPWIGIAVVFCGLILLAGCNGLKKIEPEDYFTGQQLVLAKAIEAGDLEKVKQLAPETDLNTPGEQDLTILYFALNETYYNNNPKPRLQIVTALVKEGADPLQPLPRGMASPAEMVSMGDKDIWLKALLDGGLDPNARDRNHNEAIIYNTLKARNTNTLALLIMRGADVDARDILGQTPLVEAFFSNRFEHVIYLLEHDANPDPVDKNGRGFAALVQRRIKKSQPDTEYHQNCLRLRDKMIALGVKWPPEA